MVKVFIHELIVFTPTKGVYRNRKQTYGKLTLGRGALVVVDPNHQTASILNRVWQNSFAANEA